MTSARSIPTLAAMLASCAHCLPAQCVPTAGGYYYDPLGCIGPPPGGSQCAPNASPICAQGEWTGVTFPDGWSPSYVPYVAGNGQGVTCYNGVSRLPRHATTPRLTRARRHSARRSARGRSRATHMTRQQQSPACNAASSSSTRTRSARTIPPPAATRSSHTRAPAPAAPRSCVRSRPISGMLAPRARMANSPAQVAPINVQCHLQGIAEAAMSSAARKTGGCACVRAVVGAAQSLSIPRIRDST